MGSPGNPTKPQVDRMLRASRLTVRSIRVVSPRDGGGATLTLHLPLQGVALIELGGR